MSEGWICPKCGSVYAPFVAECANCKTMPVVLSGSTNTRPTFACTCGSSASNGVCPLHGGNRV